MPAGVMLLQSLDRYRPLGLLILRVGIGLSIALAHGWGKIIGGPEQWSSLGQTVQVVGISFLPVFWGFMSAVTEFVGGLLVVLGFLTRPALILLIINMAVAATGHAMGAIPGSPLHAIELGIVFLALFFTGPGKYSFDDQFGSPRRRRALRF